MKQVHDENCNKQQLFIVLGNLQECSESFWKKKNTDFVQTKKERGKHRINIKWLEV